MWTGRVPAFMSGGYNVTTEVWPETAKANVVLEIDGDAIEQVLIPNKPLRVTLQAGVRALTVHTKDDVRLQFQKLRLQPVGRK